VLSKSSEEKNTYKVHSMNEEPETHAKTKSLNNRFGFVINCDPYQRVLEYYNSELGLGGSVVSKPVQCLPEKIPIRLYFDNYFTSFRLINHLKENNLFVTGTVRSNRIDKYPLHDIDKMEKSL